MSIFAQYDKEMQKMVLKTEDKLLAVLDAKEAEQFKKEYENALSLLELDHKVEQNDYAQIIMEDLEHWLEYPDDEEDESAPWHQGTTFEGDVLGINIEVRWMTRLDRTEDSVYVLKKDGDYESLDMPDLLRRNFTKEQVKFGQASNRQIRRCFDEEVLKYIEAHPHFVVKFCDVEMPREYLFSDEKEMLFDFESSSDT